MENELVKASATPQNKKGRTITFRVDDEVAEKFKNTLKCVIRACPECFEISGK